MALPLFTSAYRALAHGALNWDTPLRSDMAFLETGLNNATGADGVVGYAGTCVDFGSGFITQCRRTGQQCTLVLGVNPGANGLSSGSSNNLIGATPVGFRPFGKLVFRAEALAGSWAGAYAQIQLNADGTIVANFVSTTTLGNGTLLSGSVSYTLP